MHIRSGYIINIKHINECVFLSRKLASQTLVKICSASTDVIESRAYFAFMFDPICPLIINYVRQIFLSSCRFLGRLGERKLKGIRITIFSCARGAKEREAPHLCSFTQLSSGEKKLVSASPQKVVLTARYVYCTFEACIFAVTIFAAGLSQGDVCGYTRAIVLSPLRISRFN